MSLKLRFPDTPLKKYWSKMNKFLNKKRYQIFKIPNISPLLVNSKLISDFHKNA